METELYNNGYYRVIDRDGYLSFSSLYGGVAVIPRTPEGDFLLLSIYRPAMRQTMLEFPRGFIEKGETPAQAAARELREEICGAGSPCRELGAATMDSGVSSSVNHYFVCENVRYDPQRLQAEEHIRAVRAVSPSEFARMIAGGGIIDSFTLIGFAKLKALGEL